MGLHLDMQKLCFQKSVFHYHLFPWLPYLPAPDALLIAHPDNEPSCLLRLIKVLFSQDIVDSLLKISRILAISRIHGKQSQSMIGKKTVREQRKLEKWTGSGKE